jgi:hypothetical protein
VRRLWSLVALAGVAAALLYARSADASPASPAAAAQRLLASRGFEVAGPNQNALPLDAVNLVPLDSAHAPASSWAAIERALGRVVLVPAWMVDGQEHPYGGSGLPPSVLAVLPADAARMVGTGLYVEAPP